MSKTTKVPPQAVDAETAVLGAMMIEKEAVLKAIDLITEKDFYKETHAQIFSAITKLYIDNQPADLFTVTDLLKQRGQLDKIGGSPAIAEMINSVQTAANVESYCKIIKDKSTARQLINISSKIIEKAFEEQTPPEELIDEIQSSLFSLAVFNKKKGFVALSEITHTALRDLEKLHTDSRDVSGLATGFTDFDVKTKGLHPGELIIIAARPSMGKTALALNIAEHVGINLNKGVAFYSLEMTKEDLMMRLVSSIAKVNLGNLRNGRYNAKYWADLTAACEKISKSQIFVNDDSDVNIIEIRAQAMKLASQLKSKGSELALVVVDYIQFMRAAKQTATREQEVAQVSRGLKALAKDLSIPVIAISQLSRRTDDRNRKDAKPQLSDLRDSGCIEQDADVVAMLYREGYYNREDPDLKNQATLILSKQRNGPTGEIDLIYKGEYTKFYNKDWREDGQHGIPENINS